jgi:hypothetical protein
VFAASSQRVIVSVRSWFKLLDVLAAPQLVQRDRQFRDFAVRLYLVGVLVSKGLGPLGSCFEIAMSKGFVRSFHRSDLLGTAYIPGEMDVEARSH